MNEPGTHAPERETTEPSLSASPSRRREVWDCLLFNDELDLLEVRLGALAGIVDHVVVVEGTTTFAGAPKPLHFADGDRGVWSFPGVVHSVVVDLSTASPEPWDRENAQRSGMRRYLLEHAASDDLLLIGDVDELPRPSVVRRLIDSLERPARLWLDDTLYYANWLRPEPWQNGPIATRLAGLDQPLVREILGETSPRDRCFVEEYVTDAGWHLSFLGGAGAIRRKLAAYSHQELNTAAIQQPPFLEHCLRYGTHFAGWTPLRKMRRDELEPFMLELADLRPDLFHFDDVPPRRATLAWCAWARVRTSLPARLRMMLDRHPRLVVGPGAVLLVPVQLVRDRRRRRRARRRIYSNRRLVASRA